MEFIGKGLYSVQLAAGLTGVPAPKIRRWMVGYASGPVGKQSAHSPLFRSEFSQYSEVNSLSFLDLVEIMFIDGLRRHGFSLQLIRLAALRAAKSFDSAHPFALKKLYTDGSRIFLRILEEEPESVQLIDLKHRQLQLDAVVLPGLMECIDFNQFDVASRWWPEGRGSPVVVDPEVMLGQPHLQGYGLSTSMLARMAKKGREAAEIADWYEVPTELVRLAIDFERKRAA